uniref:Autotransporter adhesin n=1 Tax=Histophilus somni (strain 129Pt) TaxID=205914 RepID=Q0I2J5_HISS1
MNKIFKTKYDVTTGQTKVVSELANNRQVASRVEAAGSQPKCGVFLDNFLGVFKLAPLALALSVALPNVGYTANVWIEFENVRKEAVNLNEGTGIWNDRRDMNDPKNREATILSSGMNRTGADTQLRNKDFYKTVVIGSRAVGGGGGTTSIGYGTIVGKNNSAVSIGESHQGTAVGYRSFAQGNESTALGNDAVAWGESAISIGSDNIGKGVTKYTKKGLAYEVWGLFRKAGKNFNYTSEYSAIDSGNLNVTLEDYQHYLNTNEISTEKYFYKTHNWAYGDSSIAIGSRNVAYGQAAVAIGTASVAQGDYSTAFGIGTYAKGNSAVAVGNETYVYANNSIGVGNEVQAINDGSMVYGYQSYAGGSGAVAIGKRALANVAPSDHFTQTVEGFSDNWYEGNSTIHALGKLDDPRKHGKNKGLDDYFLPKTQRQQGTEEDKAESKNSGAVAIGYYVYALGENSIALGRQAYSKGDRSIAIGPYAYGAKEKTAALGYGSKAIGEQSMALGSLSRAEGQNSIAIGVNSAVKNETNSIKRNGQNTIAIGNETEATMDNSVALGYKSTTKYFYKDDTDKHTATLLEGKDAISLPSYAPEGTSYKLSTDAAAGIVSVGWKKNSNELGLRRIVGVAPGALDSDVATVGQLKALYYVKKEGVVTYYTKEADDKLTKLTKEDNKFYKVNTKDGTPYKALGEVKAENVFVGPKGANETTKEETIQRKKYSLGDMGNKIKFAHILDGNIETGSDQAITGNQLNQLGSSILGLTVKTNDKTQFDKVLFEAVEYIDTSHQAGKRNTFKDALTDTINAVNKGYKFSDGSSNTNKGPYYLGATIEIKAGEIDRTYKSNNLKTKLDSNKNDKAVFTIGLSDTPEFTSVKVTAAPTENNHAVNKAYVDEKLQNVSTNLHYLSVKGTDSKKGPDSNYNNDGAKASNSVAIGVGAKVEAPTDTQNYIDNAQPNAEGGVAIGYNAQSKAKNAIVIGTNVSVDIPNSFVLGSNNIVDQNSKGTKKHLKNKYDAKGERDAVVVIGSGTILKNSKSSIAIGAVNMGNGTSISDNTPIKGNYLENARWTAVIGNKNRVYNGTDMVVLGNNIQVNTNKSDFNESTNTNDNLVIMGNKAIAANAAGSVVIGNEAKALNGDEKNHVYQKVENVVSIGKEATTKASGAIAIGEEATVEQDAGESIALGKGSKAKNKEEAKKDTNVMISENSTNTKVKFKWTGGVSSNSGNEKSILSIGDTNKERIIKHVAPGAVTNNSTDAINGSQLYAVADEFSKLAVNVLGAEVDTGSDRTGFKKSTFDVAKYQGSTNTPTQKEMTFKDAIGQNTTAINKGFIFGVGEGSGEKGTHYLGDKLIIKAGAVDKPSTTQDGGYVPDNIKTAYLSSTKEIVIGIKESPTFKNVLITEEIPENTSADPKKNTYDNYAVNKKYLDKRLEKVAANFTVKGDSNGTDGKGYTLDKDNNELTIAGDSKNIETKVDKDSKKVSITLKDALTGITSIANDDTKIELKNNGGKSIIFKTGASGNDVTLSDGKLSGVSEIGKDENAKITFNSNGQKEIDFKAGSTTYKFKETGLDLASKPITNLASGLDQNGSGGTNVRQGLDELLKLIGTNGQPSGSSNSDKLNKAINAGDLLHVAQGLVDKGLKFKVDNGTSTSGSTTETTKKLGDTLTFKGDGKYLTTKLNDTNGEISFNLSVAESISDASTQNTTNNKLVTENAVKNFVTNKLNNLSSTLQLEGDNTKNDKDPADPIGKVELKTQKLKLTGETNEIVTEVTKDNPSVKIKLAQKVKNKLEIINVGENTNDDNSFALGQNSTLEAKKLAPSEATPNVGSNDVTITWNTAGASKDKNDLREVVSVGSADKERIITHVAAGAVQSGSTDAINGGQLHSVIDVFGKLGLDVLGAEKADTGDGFKKSKFDVVKTNGNATDSNPEKSEKTFKKAIEDNIAAINKGLKFASDNDGEKQLYLGSTLNIKGAKGEASSAGSNSASSDTTNNHQNIFTKASDTGLEIALNEALQGISSISGKKGTDGSAVAKIDFTSGGSTSPTVKITADDGEFTFGKDGLNLNSKQITGIASGLGLKDSADGNSGGSAGTSNSDTEIINKVLSGNPDKDNNNGNKIANNAINVKDLSEVAKALVKKGLSFEGNGGNTDKVTRKLGETLKIVGKGDQAKNITVADNNIKVSKKAETNGSTTDTLEIGLSDTLTAIKSIANGENAKITLSGSNGSKDKITFKAGSSEVTLADGKFSGVSEINKESGKAALKLEADKATLESASGNSKVELKDKAVTITAKEDKGSLKLTENTATLESTKDGSNVTLDSTSATLSAGNGKGSIKVATGSGDGANKIELSPENGSAVTLAKDGTNGVKATGLSTVGLDDKNALVFKNDTIGTAELKVGGATLKFTPTGNGTGGTAQTVKISNVAVGKIESSSSEAITGRQLHDLATHLGVSVKDDSGKKIAFEQPTFAVIKGGTKDAMGGTTTATGPTTFKDAINQLITAVNGGLTFKGNDNGSTPSSTTLQLGGTLTIDSSPVSSTTEKDITVSLTPSTNGDAKDAGTLTLKLNKADKVDENDEKVVTSKAVATKLQEYTRKDTLIEDLEEYYLEIDGANVKDKAIFGENVGIEKINLEEDETEGTSELVQAKALVDYLKGTGEKSVKLSDSAKTQAIGEGSISIGYNANSQNEGSIALGYNSSAKNKGAISIGQDSTVLGTSSIAVGKENDVKGNFSFVLGEGNTLDKEQTYVIGSDNEISGAKNIAIGLGNTVGGNENIVLGSHVDLKDDVEGAIVLGDKSIGVSNAVSVGNALTKRRIVFVDTPQGEYDAVNKKYVDDLTLSYKANSTEPAKSINLKTGALDFVNSENISVAVEADGKITHTLNNELKEIGSISATKDEKGAKITLSKPDTSPDTSKTYEKYVSFNEAKIKDILDGTISSDSKDAVTGKQLADLAKQLGVDVNTSDKTKFTAPIFEYLSNVDGSFNKNPTTLKGAIDEARAKLNEGLKFGGDIPSAGTNTNNTHYLGSTINIVRLGTQTGGAVAPTSTSGYSGSNLITQYTYDKGNAKIEIGFKDAPEFRKVTLSKQTYGDSKIGNEDVITKSYLEQALNSFKFNVAYDNKTVQIGRGDTLKFENGLNIQGNLKQEGATQPSAVTSTPAPTAPDVASGSESSAPASTSSGSENGGAGTTVVSNGASSDSADTAVASSSPTAGTSSTPTTTPSDTSTPTTTTPTTAVVTIGTKNDLTDITSISSKSKDGSTGGSGTGSSAGENDADNGTTGEVTKLTLDPTKGATFQVGKQGSQVTINDDGISLTPKGANGTNNPSASTPSIVIKPADSTSSATPADPSLPAVDNGPSITFSTKDENGKKIGFGTIKGLADIKPNETDGSIAANKNYVDSKIKEVTAGQPFEYATIKDNAKVVRGVDGKLYKEADLNKYYYDEKTASYKPRDPKNSSMTELKALKNDEVIVNLMPKGDDKSPIAIGNVKSILDAEVSTNQDKAAKAIEELIKEQGTLSTKKDNVATGSDIAALAKAGLNFGVSTGEDIHRNLGEKISIVGRDLKAEILKEMNISNGKVDDDKKAEYEAKLAVAKKAIADGFSTKNVVTIANQNSVVINIADKPEFKAISIKDDTAPGMSLDLNPNAISMEDDDGNNTVMDAGGMVVTDNNGSTEVNANNISLTDSEDKESNLEAGKLVLSHTDKELVVEVGEKGGKITGLEVRHPTDSDYGTDTTRAATESAVKKNRDDVEDGVIGPMVYTDNNGNRLVKVEGKYYLVSDVENGKAKEKANAVANPALSLVNADRNGGDTKAPVVLNNVAAGELSENSRQAVNGAQLHQTNVHVQNNSLRINNLQNQVNILNKDMRAGVAQALAQANLPVNILPGKSTLSLATGNYMGTQAFAVGYSRVSDNGKLSVKFSLGHGDKKTSVGAGIGYSW